MLAATWFMANATAAFCGSRNIARARCKNRAASGVQGVYVEQLPKVAALLRSYAIGHFNTRTTCCILIVRQHYTLMNYIVIIYFVVAMALGLTVFGIRRFRMERQASTLLAQHPGAEQTSVYLQLYSPFPWDRQRELDAKIAEMQPQGWTFLRARPASLLRAFRSWGGCLKVDFIRRKV